MSNMTRAICCMVLISTVDIFCMSVAAHVGAAMGAVAGASVGTFIVMDDAKLSNALRTFDTREERIEALLTYKNSMTLGGSIGLGATAGACVGLLEGAIIVGAKYAINDIKNNGIRGKGAVSAALLGGAVFYGSYRLSQILQSEEE